MATFYKDDPKILVRDQNRFRKVYRYIRKKPRPLLCTGDTISNFTWGSFYVDFENQSLVTHAFPCCYGAVPVVVATSVETASGVGLGNVNTFISNITADQATFQTSALYTGRVHYQALLTGVYTMPNIGKTMEVVELSYSNTDTNTYNWDSNTNFTCIPIVTATASEDVNVFITAVSTSAITVKVSDANYNGKVYLIAVERGC